MRQLIRRSLIGSVFMILAWLSLPSLASANMMGTPWGSGDRLSEPIGTFQQLHILQEALVLDLRSLASDQVGQIAATYDLENRGATTTTDLVFISPGIASGQVTLDGTPLSFQPVPEPDIPADWTTTIAVPTLNSTSRHWLGDRDQSVTTLSDLYQVSANQNDMPSALQFQATLTPGAHQLQVQYRVNPYTFDGDNLYREYGVGYILAPATTWASIGQLTITVQLPESWQVATSLPLNAQNHTLNATFDGIPAHGFVIVTSPQLWPISRLASLVFPILGWLGGLAICVFLGWRIGRLARWQDWKMGRLAIAIVLLPIVAGVLQIIAVLLGNTAGYLVLNDKHLSATWSYNHSIVQFLVMPASGVVVGAIATMVALLFTRYRRLGLVKK